MPRGMLALLLLAVRATVGQYEPTPMFRSLQDAPPPFAVPVPTLPSVQGPTVVVVGTPTTVVADTPTTVVVGTPTAVVVGTPTVDGTPTIDSTPTAGVPTVPSPGVPTEKPNSKVSIPTWEPSKF